MRLLEFHREIVGLVDAAAFLGEVVAPVVVEVAVAAQRAELEHGFGAAESQRAPVMSMRSLTRWRVGSATRRGTSLGLVLFLPPNRACPFPGTTALQ